MTGSTLEVAYGILLDVYKNVIAFTFNDMLMFSGGFSFGNLILTASLAWIIIKAITHRFLERERVNHIAHTSKEYGYYKD